MKAETPRFTVSELECHGPNAIVVGEEARVVFPVVKVNQRTGEVTLLKKCPYEWGDRCILNNGYREAIACKWISEQPSLMGPLGLDEE